MSDETTNVPQWKLTGDPIHDGEAEGNERRRAAGSLGVKQRDAARRPNVSGSDLRAEYVRLGIIKPTKCDVCGRPLQDGRCATHHGGNDDDAIAIT